MNETKAKMLAALKRARDLAATVEAADRDFTPEEQQQIKGLLEEAKGYKAQLAAREADADLVKQIEALGVGLVDTSERGAKAAVAAGAGKSIGERFTSSPEYVEWLKRFPNGQIPDSAKGLMSPPVGFRGLNDFGMKTLITGVSSTSAGAFVISQDSGIMEPLGRRPLTVVDLITVRQTSTDTIEYVRQTSRVNAAAPVAEATATGDGSGVKPEGGFAFERVSDTVKTIAEWVPATKRALSDASQLRGLIDSELRDDLAEELEDQVVNGTGGGENFTGLAATANTQDQAFDTDILTTLRKARTKVRTVGRSTPTAYLMHPNDWERIDLLQDNEGRYYYGGPMQMGQPRIWGLPVVESEAAIEGTAWVGDFRKAVLWDREQSTIQVSDSHSDFFIRNMIAVLAELRAGFGITRPTAFVEIDLTA